MNAPRSGLEKVFTCTPVAFGGGEDFFARDSGLLSRGLRACGVASRAVMPGPAQPGDLDELIRTDAANLTSPQWWRSLGIDAVVLYAWGSPKYLGVARAIRLAGVRLVLNQDNGGLISPFAGLAGWGREQWLLHGQGLGMVAWMRWTLALTKGLSVGLVLVDLPRARHLSQGDVIACVSPRAAEHYRRMCRRYGGDALAARVRLLPHAVENRFVWRGETKSRQILAVGRWQDSNQKRPGLLTAAGERLLQMDAEVRLVVVGGITPGLEAWHRGLSHQLRERVRLAGRLDRAELAAEMCRSQVFYSPSAFESFGIAAAESLCCGCSVVAQQSVSMSAFDWFVGDGSGRLATTSSPQDHAEQLAAELRCWDDARRNPGAISSVWSDRFHAERVAEQVLKLLAESTLPAQEQPRQSRSVRKVLADFIGSAS